MAHPTNESTTGKVGIVTVMDYRNYGNRLQNYAVQQVLERRGYACETIVNSPTASTAPGKVWTGPVNGERRMKARAGRASPLRRAADRWTAEGPARFIGDLLGKVRRSLAHTPADKDASTVLSRLKSEKVANGRAWTARHIAESDFVVFRDTAAEHLDDRYDHFVVGSDQVWNPYFRRLSRTDFLPFASPRKRIAWSASMGISDIPRAYRGFYRAGLEGLAHIAVREDAAAKVVHSLTGRIAAVTVDPTLMLGADDWIRITTDHPAKPVEPYVLTYFFGRRGRQHRQVIDDCVARHGLAAVHLNDRDSPQTYTADPAAFLGFVRGASMLLTDSFHGVIFAVLMDTPFLCFDRVDSNVSTNSRIDTLLRTLGLEHRKFRHHMSTAERDALFEADYGHTREIIDRKRRETTDYLDTALGRSCDAAQPAR